MKTESIVSQGETFRKQAEEYREREIRDNLDVVMLGLLEVKRELHGYAMIDYIKKNYGIFLGPSTVYPILRSLERKGDVESRWELSDQTNKHQKRYSITSQGKQTLYAGMKGLRDGFNNISYFPAIIERNIRWQQRARLRMD